jgi:hypothetical protein
MIAVVLGLIADLDSPQERFHQD